MRHWLLKTEPDVYSIDDLRREGRTDWDRIRNHQVKLFLRDAMATGDRCLIYHSNAEPTGVVGTAVVCGAAVPDATQFRRGDESFEPRATRQVPVWWARPVRFGSRFDRCVELAELRAEPRLRGLATLKRGNRLSVTPVTAAEFACIEAMGGRVRGG
ncbi:MAG: EVE domain-containing protein [Planctomycetes bacterium]|nr:EVE domain-containing protein [Planctomycetota bacterium]